MLKVLAISLIGGYMFSLLHIPIPWMLGPIFSILIAQFLYKGTLLWSPKLRDFGLVIVGIAIGEQFNLALFRGIGILLLYMLLLNVILIACSVVLALGLSKWSKLPLKSMVLGTIPGGLGQIVVFAEEEKDVDLAAVTYFHIVRLLLVVVFIPFIVSGHIISKPPVDVPLTFGLAGLILTAWGCSYMAKRLKMPIAYFLTPILLIIGLQLTSFDLAPLPSPVMNGAQLLIGAHIGLLLKPHMIKLPYRYLLAGIMSAVGLIFLTYGTSFIVSSFLGYSFATSFLSTAPGGLDQMVLLADAVGADVSVISVFQVFRLLFIFLLVMPALRFYYQIAAKKQVLERKRGIV
ncbi:AbrB family transcriptional regulator [Bacillus massiliglaciei]|uniref:AbrB family transcriptional regulator n=1 Tax=Bacillus massiliglaciei TaxID=1816693 RepID=UPI000DA6060D|nr:AbrB family transcriptional regulator [Bacillus massiliglaciei]